MLLRKAVLLLACYLFSLIAVGCAAPPGPAGQRLHTGVKDKEKANLLEDALAGLMRVLDGLRGVDTRRYVGGKSVEGRALKYTVLGKGGDAVLILAAIHGDEPAGTPLVLRLQEYMRRHPVMLRGRQVVLVPVANPDGSARESRFNANGVDLNRNFRAANRLNGGAYGDTALSEPEARFIEMLVRRYTPGRIVSIHQPYACIDYDGPARALAGYMAKYCDLPVRRLGAQAGSLGSYAGETLYIPTITFELPADADLLDAESLWEKYGTALIAAVTYPDVPE